MKKIQSTIITITILAVGISASYYFFIFKPKLDTEKLLFERQAECAQKAQTLYNSIIFDAEKEGHILKYGHEYYYNPKIKKCLLSYGYGYGEVLVRYVKDVYTNENILSYGITNFDEWNMPFNEYDKKRKELFNQE